MRIRWTPAGLSDMKSISDYLKEHHPNYRSLKAFPHRGRPGQETGTRELVFSPLPYIAVYRVKEVSIEVVHIHHGAQNRT